MCQGVSLVARREAQCEEGSPVLFPSDWVKPLAVLSPAGKGDFCSLPKHLRALLTEPLCGCSSASWGGSSPAVSRGASLPPSCPPAVYPLNHKLFSEIPCPVHHRDGAVSLKQLGHFSKEKQVSLRQIPCIELLTVSGCRDRAINKPNPELWCEQHTTA